jgi:uncharacterized membrane-anchored protein YitT (DUF2179 family)
MHFWNIAALKQRLVTNELSEAGAFAYFLAVMALQTLVWEVFALFPAEEPDAWGYGGAAGSIVLTVAGTLLAFRCNGGADGVCFLARYFALYWVLTIRFLVWTVPAAVVVFVSILFAHDSLFGSEESMVAVSRWAVVATWLWLALYYYRLAVHIRDVARGA